MIELKMNTKPYKPNNKPRQAEAEVVPSSSLVEVEVEVEVGVEVRVEVEVGVEAPFT